MKKLKKGKLSVVVNSLVGSVLTTMILMVLSFLMMMFSSAEEGRRTCFFDTLFFSNVTEADGSLSIVFGLTGKLMPIFITIAIIFCFIMVVYTIYKKLELYQKKIISENSGTKNNG